MYWRIDTLMWLWLVAMWQCGYVTQNFCWEVGIIGMVNYEFEEVEVLWFCFMKGNIYE